MASDSHLANEHSSPKDYHTEKEATECNEREVIGLKLQMCFAK